VGFRLAQLRPASAGLSPGSASDGPPLEDGAEPAEVVDDLRGVLTGQRLGRHGLEGRAHLIHEVGGVAPPSHRASCCHPLPWAREGDRHSFQVGQELSRGEGRRPKRLTATAFTTGNTAPWRGRQSAGCRLEAPPPAPWTVGEPTAGTGPDALFRRRRLTRAPLVDVSRNQAVDLLSVGDLKNRLPQLNFNEVPRSGVRSLPGGLNGLPPR
jgi:hypothetical protein